MGKLANLLENIKRYSQKDTSSLAFWWLPLDEGDGDYDININQVKDYYLDFSTKADYTTKFDRNGVMMLDYKGKLGVRYNPCAIAQYGLGLLSCYLSAKKKLFLDNAITQAKWLVENLKIDKNGIGRWVYDKKFTTNSEGNLFPDFVSSIAQGQGISFLLRIYIITKERCFAETAKAAFKLFFIDVHQHGVQNRDEQGNIYLEEWPTDRVSCILDGFMYAIFGVYDYWKIMEEAEAENLFWQCIQTLKIILPAFDLGYWSRMDMYIQKRKLPASAFYHNVHIHQLKALYLLTKEELFLEYSQRWKKYQQSRWCRSRAFITKCISKVFYY